MNVISLIGRAGADPEIKTGTGTSGDWMTAKVNMAVYRPAKEKADQTLWVSVEAWGKSAETLKNYVKKGDQFAVDGSLDHKKWTTQQGEQKDYWFIRVNKVHLIGGTKDGASTTQAKPASSSVTPPAGRGW